MASGHGSKLHIISSLRFFREFRPVRGGAPGCGSRPVAALPASSPAVVHRPSPDVGSGPAGRTTARRSSVAEAPRNPSVPWVWSRSRGSGRPASRPGPVGDRCTLRLPRPSASSAGSFAVRRGPPAHPPDPARWRGARAGPGGARGCRLPRAAFSPGSFSRRPSRSAHRSPSFSRTDGRSPPPSSSNAGPPAPGPDPATPPRDPHTDPGPAIGNRSTGPSKSQENQAGAHATGNPSSTGTAAHAPLRAGLPHGDGPSTTVPEAAAPDESLPRRSDRSRSDPPDADPSHERSRFQP